MCCCRAGSCGETSEMADGPWFVSEPPALLEFTNQTGATVSCVASGHPPPSVVWLAASSELGPSAGGLADIAGLRRIVTTASRNATLILTPFAATAYRPDVHSTAYRCRASSPAGTILSREMRVRAGKFGPSFYYVIHFFWQWRGHQMIISINHSFSSGPVLRDPSCGRRIVRQRRNWRLALRCTAGHQERRPSDGLGPGIHRPHHLPVHSRWYVY